MNNDVITAYQKAIDRLKEGGLYHKRILDRMDGEKPEYIKKILKFTQKQFESAKGGGELQKALMSDPDSIIEVALKFVELGFSTDKIDGEGYVRVAYNRDTKKQEAVIWIGYKGIVKYLQSCGRYGIPSINLIYDNDDFAYKPSNVENPINHTSNILSRTKDSKIVGCWLRMKDLKTDECHFHVTSRERLERAKKIGGPAWGTDEASMAKKTCLLDGTQFIVITDKKLSNYVQIDREHIAESVEKPPKITGGAQKFGKKREEPHYEPIDEDAQLILEADNAAWEAANGEI